MAVIGEGVETALGCNVVQPPLLNPEKEFPAEGRAGGGGAVSWTARVESTVAQPAFLKLLVAAGAEVTDAHVPALNPDATA